MIFLVPKKQIMKCKQDLYWSVMGRSLSYESSVNFRNIDFGLFVFGVLNILAIFFWNSVTIWIVFCILHSSASFSFNIMWYDEVLQYISGHVQQVLLIDWLFGLKGFQCKVKLCTKILVGGVTVWYRNLALTLSFKFLNYQQCFYASKIVKKVNVHFC